MTQDKVLDLAQKLFMIKRVHEKLGNKDCLVNLTTEELEMIGDVLLFYHQEKANGCC